MNLLRRQFLHLAAGAAALPALPHIAWAQAYPTRPLRIIVPFPAGQASDTIARLMGQSLSERLGQPFVIENRTGAGGNIGTESVVRTTPDGYTLLLVGVSNAMNATTCACRAPRMPSDPTSRLLDRCDDRRRHCGACP
jgi:tripartite-type tricarboxylate transporter receptor subunit TctC